ncbi:MAG TPA: glycosyltransferase family 2 protein [bacterium]
MTAWAPASPALPPLTLLSVVIPARDEEESLPSTLEHLGAELQAAQIPHEIVVVDDGSSDGTWAALQSIRDRIPALRPVQNRAEHGFGRAVRHGLRHSRGDAVVIVMADGSDDARDVARYWRALGAGWECVFGSRFVEGASLADYPRAKLVLNRVANAAIAFLFGIPLDDTTNAFKGYRRSVISGCEPLVSSGFELTVELPLKAIVRGYSWTVVPVSWRNRRHGVPKLKLRNVACRYAARVLSVWVERLRTRRAPGCA